MITVFRHEVPPFRETNVFEVKLHRYAAVISVDQIRVPANQARSRGLAGDVSTVAEGPRKDTYEYYLWAVEDTTKPIESRRFWFVRDGDVLDPLGDDAALYHLTTFRSTDGSLWCHVFDVTHLPDDFEPRKRVGPSTFKRRKGRVERQGAGREVRPARYRAEGTPHQPQEEPVVHRSNDAQNDDR